MRQIHYYLIPILLLCQANAIQAAPLSSVDKSNLISAIDDYRFSDYDVAIPQLENLHRKSMENIDVLQYLALSYEENEDPEKAIPAFKSWLILNHNDTSENSRFAWLGLAQAYMKTGQLSQAVSTLSQWTTANPNDIQSQITMGDMLIKQKEFTHANQIWDQIINNTKANVSHKAGAWYYKAWIAYLQQDSENTLAYAKKSLQLDPKGAYASAAKQLESNPSQHRLGFNGLASLETFYNSNVKLLPSASSSLVGDKGIQSNLVLSWGLTNLDLSYILSLTKHQDLSAYDLQVHILSATWKKGDALRIMPSYEYINLDSDKLYQSLGLGVAYKPQDWSYNYALKLKTFNSAYGSSSVDLTRLSGSSHNLSATTYFDFTQSHLTLTPYFLAELSKGDATHNHSDSYYQLGGNISTDIRTSKSWNTQLKMNIYSRSYAAADTNILLTATDTTKRNDLFFKVSASESWRPWTDYDISLVINASYLKNNSNYDDSLVSASSSKSYSSWRVGTMVLGQW